MLYSDKKTTLSSVRNIILMTAVSGYLILNYGFMQIRIPPTTGSGIPLGELLIIFFLLTIHYPTMIPRLSSVFPASLLVIWWFYICCLVVMGFSKHGLWAARDATNVIESVFLIGGFVYAQNPVNIDRFFKWIPRILFVGSAYVLTYPIGTLVASMSPKILGGAGQIVPIMGTYINSALILLWTATYILIFNSNTDKKFFQKIILSVFLTGYALLLFQARTVYLQIFSIFMVFFLYRKDLVNKFSLAIVICLAFVTILPIFDIVFTGRIGQVVSIDFLIYHFMAIFGQSSEGLEQAAGGVFQRTGWWESIWHRLTENLYTFFFGLGYGFPLIDFHVTGGIPVREPHNSYISFLARSGVIGLAFFIWVHFLLLKVWHKSYQTCLKRNWDIGANRLIVLLVYFVLVWIFATGQDAFEKPFNTVPYYFFWGVILRFSYHLKAGEIGPNKKTHENSALT